MGDEAIKTEVEHPPPLTPVDEKKDEHFEAILQADRMIEAGLKSILLGREQLQRVMDRYEERSHGPKD